MPLSRIQSDALQSAITSSNIADGTIVAADLASNSVTDVKIASSAVTAAKIASGAVEGYMSTAGTPFMFRNKIINGAMNVSQRGITPLTNLGTYSYRLIDFHRTGGGNQVTGKYSIAQKDALDTTSAAYEANSAPPGFRYSLKYTVETAYSPTADTGLFHSTFIEGLNAADTAWGTANAKTCTLSFWVKSTTTGTMEVQINNNNSPYCVYRAGYTINAANTWEYKTITIPGPTVGTWTFTRDIAPIRLDFTIWNGTSGTYPNLTNTWYNNETSGGIVSGRVAPFSTAGTNIYFTGMQFEIGSSATPFEHRPFGMELALCQRYFETSFIYGNQPQNGATTTSYPPNNNHTQAIDWSAVFTSGTINGWQKFIVPKRISPSVTLYGTSAGKCIFADFGTKATIYPGMVVGNTNVNGFSVYNDSTGLTGNSSWGYNHYGWSASAEF